MNSHLNPGTPLTSSPSRKCHVTIGGGFPCTKHAICDPVVFPNINRAGGSCIKVGGWLSLSISDNTQERLSENCTKKHQEN